MAWEFSTDPEYQEQLDWADAFVRGNLWPLESIALAGELDMAQLDRAIALYPRIESFLQKGFRECAPFASSLTALDALFDVYGG